MVLNGATVRDAQGTDAVLDFGASPRIASLAIGAAPGGDGTWDAGERVEVAVTFEEPVAVDTEAGTPTLRATVGAGAYAIPYATGTGTDTLTFAVTREDGAAPAPTVIVEGDSLALNGGAIRSTSGLEVDIAHPGGGARGLRRARAREHRGERCRSARGRGARVPPRAVAGVGDAGARRLRDRRGHRARRRRLRAPVGDGELRAGRDGEDDRDRDAQRRQRGAGRDAHPAPFQCAGRDARHPPRRAETIEASTGADTFTGAFSGVPEEHDGKNEFTLTLTFDEEPEDLSYGTVRDSLFTREGGTIGGARRESAGSNQAFVLTVTPSGNEAVTLTLKTVPPCGQDNTVCTAGGAVLSGPLGVTVPGPAALSVADAQAQEGPGATLDFVVSLDRGRHAPVSVDYATEPGEAVAGDDYAHTAGTLTFSPGETRLTVSVPVLADEHDEGSETLTLELANPVGARIADGEAVGTIRNNGAIPKAWIARFGRTVADQVLVAVEGRFEAPRQPGVEVSLAGQRLDIATPEEVEALERREAQARLKALGDWLAGGSGEAQDGARAGESRALTGRDLLAGSAFALTAQAGGTGTVSLWGRGAVSRFDGRDGDLALDGEVLSAMLGADWVRGRWSAGLIVTHGEAEGGYSGAPGASGGPGAGAPSAAGSGGKVESTLTGVFPWGRHALSERLAAWGAAGYGEGELTVTPSKPGTDEDGTPVRADLDLWLAAGGLRGELLDPGSGSGFRLTGKTDADGRCRPSSGRGRSAGGGHLAPARATVTRLRLGLEGSRPMRLGAGAALTPSVEVGLRRDGGDAERGFGVDVGAGLGWSDRRRGLEAELRGRGLLTHEDGSFGERGLSGSLSWDPRPGSALGPTFTLSRSVGGSVTGGMDALLGRETMAGLAAGDNGGELSRRLEATVGYGIPVFGGRFIGNAGGRRRPLGRRGASCALAGASALRGARGASRWTSSSRRRGARARTTPGHPSTGSGCGSRCAGRRRRWAGQRCRHGEGRRATGVGVSDREWAGTGRRPRSRRASRL